MTFLCRTAGRGALAVEGRVVCACTQNNVCDNVVFRGNNQLTAGSCCPLVSDGEKGELDRMDVIVSHYFRVTYRCQELRLSNV